MLHWPWRGIVIGAVATVLIYTATRPDPDTSGLTNASVDQLVEHLGSSREVVQRVAAVQLMNRGEAAIPKLVAAIDQAAEQHTRQIFMVLEDMYLSTDPVVCDAAEDALEKLTYHKEPAIRKAADDLFQENQSRQQLRAFAKIESFSGRLRVLATDDNSNGDAGFPDMVVIGHDWTGGEDGLKYLRRMRRLNSIHVANDAPLSDNAVKSIRTVTSFFRHESEGCLGMEMSVAYGELNVRWVAPDSPAARAGLRSQDLILQIDGELIESSRDYQRVLRSRPPGSPLALKVQREGDILDIVAETGSDFGTGRCACLGDDPPTERSIDDSYRNRGRRSRFLTDHFFTPMLQEPPQPRHFPTFRPDAR